MSGVARAGASSDSGAFTSGYTTFHCTTALSWPPRETTCVSALHKIQQGERRTVRMNKRKEAHTCDLRSMPDVREMIALNVNDHDHFERYMMNYALKQTCCTCVGCLNSFTKLLSSPVTNSDFEYDLKMHEMQDKKRFSHVHNLSSVWKSVPSAPRDQIPRTDHPTRSNQDRGMKIKGRCRTHGHSLCLPLNILRRSKTGEPRTRGNIP